MDSNRRQNGKTSPSPVESQTPASHSTHEKRRTNLDQTEDEIMRMPDVIKATGKCRSSIYAEINEGKFPRKVRLGKRAIGFSRRQIHVYIRAMIDGVEYKPE